MSQTINTALLNLFQQNKRFVFICCATENTVSKSNLKNCQHNWTTTTTLHTDLILGLGRLLTPIISWAIFQNKSNPVNPQEIWTEFISVCVCLCVSACPCGTACSFCLGHLWTERPLPKTSWICLVSSTVPLPPCIKAHLGHRVPAVSQWLSWAPVSEEWRVPCWRRRGCW